MFRIIWCKYKQFYWYLHIIKTTKWKHNWEPEPKNYQSRIHYVDQPKAGHINSPLYSGTYSRPVIPPLCKGNLIQPMEGTCFRTAQGGTKLSQGWNHTAGTWGLLLLWLPWFPTWLQGHSKGLQTARVIWGHQIPKSDLLITRPSLSHKPYIKKYRKDIFINIALYRTLWLWRIEHFF